MDVKLPDGTVIQNVPDGTSQADLMQRYQAHISAAAPKQEGSFGSFVRNAANAATFNLGDTISAAGNASIPLDSGSSTAPSWIDRFHQNQAMERGQTSSDEANHPVASIGGGLAGGFLNPVTRALPAARTIGGAALQGAGIGSAYGAGAGVSNQEDVGGIASDAAKGGLFGAALGGTLHGAGNIIKGTTRSADATLLNAKGVPTTIGQDLGGGYKRAEDAFTSMPWGGDAIIARQKEGISGFNRALENNAASPVGVTIPSTVSPGNDAGNYLKTLNDAAYKAAYTGATVQKTPQLVSDLQNATNHFPSGLDSKPIQQDFQERVLKAFDPTGTMSSQAFNDAKDWLSEQSNAGQTATRDQQNVAKAYGNAKTALVKAMTDQDPQRGAMLKAADAVYARRMPLVNASGNTAASAKDGIVTPAQFSRALDTSDNSAHGLNYSLGNLPMQDLVQAGQRVLPSSVPDSGTAIRSLLTRGVPTLAAAGAGGALGGLPAMLPAAAAAMTPMAITRLLYSQAGQKAAKAVLFGAPQTRAALAKIPPAATPALLGLFGGSSP